MKAAGTGRQNLMQYVDRRLGRSTIYRESAVAHRGTAPAHGYPACPAAVSIMDDPRSRVKRAGARLVAIYAGPGAPR